MDEAIEAITDQAFGVLSDRRVYVHDGIDRMQAHLQRMPEHAQAIVTRADLVVTSTNVDRMSAAQFALVQEVKRRIPEATVVLRSHKLAWKREPGLTLPAMFGVLVTQRVGPFTLRREYMADVE